MLQKTIRKAIEKIGGRGKKRKKKGWCNEKCREMKEKVKKNEEVKKKEGNGGRVLKKAIKKLKRNIKLCVKGKRRRRRKDGKRR